MNLIKIKRKWERMLRNMTANPKTLKGMNDALILNLIRQKGPISRADLARLSDLTPPTVTNITNKLLELGLVVEYMIGESSGGRRPVLLKINPEALDVVIVHISSDKLTGYLCDGDANIKQAEIHTIKNQQQEQILELMLTVIARCCKEAGRDVPGIGVVVHGPVKAREGVSVFAPNIGWENVPIKWIVEERFHIPAFVENDVRAMALGEYHYGCAKDANSMVFLKVGYGVGAGIVLDGKLYRGRSDSAGEIGHTTIDIGGPRCSCGNYGCLESLASENALVKVVVKAIKEGQQSLVSDLVQGNLDNVTPEVIYQAVVENDGLARQMAHRVARYLGIGIANISNSFNPELIVIGGGITRIKEYIEEPINQTAKDRALESSYRAAKICFSVLGVEATVKGAADVVMTEIVQGGLLCIS